jgi:hypothetical protein
MPPPPKYENLWTDYRPYRYRTRIIYFPQKKKYNIRVNITSGKYKDVIKHGIFYTIEDCFDFADKLINNPDETLDAIAEQYGHRTWIPKGPTKCNKPESLEN